MGGCCGVSFQYRGAVFAKKGAKSWEAGMRIEVALLAHLKGYLPEADREKSPFFVDVPDRLSVKEIIESLGVPAYIPKVVRINDSKAGLEDRVKDGDKVMVCALSQAG